jgi:hypothetical protein
MTSVIRRGAVLLPCLLVLGMASREAHAAGAAIAGINFTTSKVTSATDWVPGALIGKPVGSATNTGAGNLLVQANFYPGSGASQNWNVFGTLSTNSSCTLDIYNKSGTLLASNSASGHNNGVISNSVPTTGLGVAGTTYILLCNMGVNDTIVSSYTTP